LSKLLEVILVIAMPLSYGLAVSGFFHWLHRRRSGPATPSGNGASGARGAIGGNGGNGANASDDGEAAK
jgi:hypothetical protein